MKDYNISIDNNTPTINFNSDIIATFVDVIKPEVAELVSKYQNIVFDLSEVEMVDSIGIGFLVATFNSLKNREGTLTIKNLSPELTDLFKSMNLHKHFILDGETNG